MYSCFNMLKIKPNYTYQEGLYRFNVRLTLVSNEIFAFVNKIETESIDVMFRGKYT